MLETKPSRMVCARCGSENVLADAYAEWDVGSQRCAVTDIMDQGHYCNECDGECSIEDEFIDDDPAASEASTAEARFPLSDWQFEVASGDTRLGYREWLAGRVELEMETVDA